MYKNGKRKLDAKSGDNGVTAKISKRVAVVADRSYAWATGLKSTIDDSNLHIYSDDKLVVIKDKYPKVTLSFIFVVVFEPPCHCHGTGRHWHGQWHWHWH